MNHPISTWLNRDLVLGVLFLCIAIFGYNPVVNYFYYGGGWPFVPIIFLIVYFIGVRYTFKSKIPMLLNLVLCFWWIFWAMTYEEVYVSA